jgi:multidrug efflux pump subunit AcrA (membrane-fusion protein)
MSRGWESKSVEAQQAERAQAAASAQPSTDPRVEEADRKRKLQSLQLQRERILSERTSSPHRRTALTNALADIEEKLAELGWSIQLYP